MRLLSIPLLLISMTALSAPPNCDESDLVPGDQIGNCTSLTINNPVTITATSGLNRIYITGITGNVLIKANITIDGGNGSDSVTFAGGGNGPGGPGAHDGGGYTFGGPEDGGTSLPPDGKTTAVDSPCSGGGGGAGFATVGVNGKECSTSGVPTNRGDVATTAEFDYTFGDFRGGFGGGAGANGDSNQLGAGGGGGGALHIETTGSITIENNVTISARGGKGGDETTDGGGGGGGSGGAIWLVSATGIVNNGTIDVRGGEGGKNNATNAQGGAGSSGRYRFESAGVVSEGTGISTPTTRSSSASSRKFSSDISCGTISKNSDHKNSFFMMFLGFGFVSLLSSIRRIKKVRAY